MGVIKRGILGGFSGKVAGVVGSSWKGIAYMRALPLSVANPNTAGQQTQREAFGFAAKLASDFLALLVKPLWDRFAQQMSGYNDFIKTNIGAALPGGFWNYPDLVISKGSLTNIEFTSTTATNGSADVVFLWVNNSAVGNASTTDQLFALCINETQDEAAAISLGANRNTGTDTLVMPTNCATADVLHVYLCFRKADGTLVSNTYYETTTV